ncbi:MAG: prepilin-type N-terminal cleavage/methylation domain-containing protein, partial [Planctomycetota bacterium]
LLSARHPTDRECKQLPEQYCGFSLIESVLAMTVGSLLMLLAIGLIHKSFQLGSSNSARTDMSRGLDRLLLKFQRDARQATSVEVQPEESMVFGLAETKIEYRFEAAKLQRRVQREANSFSVDQSIELDFGGRVRDRRVSFAFQEPIVSLNVIGTFDGSEFSERSAQASLGSWLALDQDQQSESLKIERPPSPDTTFKTEVSEANEDTKASTGAEEATEADGTTGEEAATANQSKETSELSEEPEESTSSDDSPPSTETQPAQTGGNQ